LRKDVPRLFAHLKRAGLTLSLDPNDDPQNKWGEDFLEALRFVDILMPNEREACAITREDDTETALRKLASKVPLLVVKQGARGATAIEDGHCYQVDATAVSPIDAVGAGDSFNAGFLRAYLRGTALEGCMRMGNLTGAFSTTAPGGTKALCNQDAFQRFAATRGMGVPSQLNGRR
jgi:sugar/nucleoside kinase (ribokinase family)